MQEFILNGILHLTRHVVLPAVSNAPNKCDSENKLTIIHPFHPLYNQEFEFIIKQHTWSEDKVHCLDSKNRHKSFPTQWISITEIDPFVSVSACRSIFHYSDLHSLCALVSKLSDLIETKNKGRG